MCGQRLEPHLLLKPPQDLSSEQAGALARGLAELGVERLGARDVLQHHLLHRFGAIALQAQQAVQPREHEALQGGAVQLLAFCLLTGLVPGLLLACRRLQLRWRPTLQQRVLPRAAQMPASW